VTLSRSVLKRVQVTDELVLQVKHYQANWNMSFEDAAELAMLQQVQWQYAMNGLVDRAVLRELRREARGW